MRRHIAVILSVGLLALIGFSGCERSSNMINGPENLVSPRDQSEIGNLISNDALFTTDLTALNDGTMPLAKIDSAITPRLWGRWIQNASRDVVYDLVDSSTVIATITVNLTGQVWIKAKTATMDTIFYKSLNETIVRKARFVRVALMDTAHAHWRLSAVSGTQGGSTDGGIQILGVTYIFAGDTVQVSDPLNTYFEFGNKFGHMCLPEFREDPAANFKVHVTLKSADPDSDVVAAHRPVWFGIGYLYRRAAMTLVSSTPNGDGTFTRVYENSWSGAFRGRFNAFVSAITRQSIYDDAAPFSSSIWGVPFLVDPD